jgi:probable O-glycosylation ligase (exosortase A-associated)
MRDIVLTLVVGALLLVTIKHPVIGAYLWAWLSLMNPHKMTYGFAFSMPFAQAAALATLVGLLMTRQRVPVPLSSIVVFQLTLILWMTVTSLFAIADRSLVLDRWIFVMKIHVMLFVTWMLVGTAQQIRVLVWVVTLSVAFFGIKGGVWTVLTGGGGRVWGPPGGMLSGNNELAVGLVVLVPMLYFLRTTETRRWVRHALLFALVSCAFSILGSQSRGALLALLSMAFFLGLKGKYPVRSSLLIIALVGLAIAFMPDTWSNRMDTIREYQQDSSAMSRIWTWHTLWNVALSRPFVGAGFVADNAVVFGTYAPLEGVYAQFAGHVYVAHSIYFQMLGEHGFVGLGLFLAIGLAAWLRAGQLARRAAAGAEFASWMPLLMRMVQVSLIGYAAGGAFLSLAYLDLPFYIAGFVVLCDGLMRRAGTHTQAAAGVPPRAAPTAAAGMPLKGLGGR